MRKLTMMVLALMTTVACQKDYYLADLEAAEFRIEALNNSVAQLSDELTASLASLANSEKMVNDLNIEREVLIFDIEELQALLNSKNEEIVNLINDAEASDEEILTLSTEITSLNDAILVAEDKIAELATDLQDAVDNPEIVYVYVTEYVEVEVAADPVISYVVQVQENPVNVELEAQVAALQAMLDAADDVDAEIAALQAQLVDADAAKKEAVDKAATDLAALQAQLNAALAHDVIDDALIAELQAIIFGLQGDVSELQDQVLSLEGQIAALQVSLAVANTNLDATKVLLDEANFGNAQKTIYINELIAETLSLTASLTAAMNQQIVDEQAIASLKAEIAGLNTDITDFKNAVESLQGVITSLTTELTQAKTSLSTTEATLAAVEGEKADLQATYDALVITNETLEDQLAAALEVTDTDEDTIAALNAQITDFKAEVLSLETQVADLMSENDDLEAANVELQAQVDALTGQLSNTMVTLSDTEAKLLAAEGDNSDLQAEYDKLYILAEEAFENLEAAISEAIIDEDKIAELEAQIAELNTDIAALNTKIDGLEAAVACNTPESTSSTFSTWLPAYDNNTETFTQEAVETVTDVYAEDCGKDNVVTTLHVTREIVVTATPNNVSSNEFSIKQDVNGDGDMLDDVTNIHTTYSSSLGTTYSSSPWVIETNHTDCTPVITEVPAGDVFLPVYDSAIHDETFTQTKSSFKTYTYNELCDEETYTEETVVESQVITISYTTVESSPMAEPYTNLDVNNDGDKLDFYREVTTTKHVTGQPDEVLGVTYLIETNN